MPPAGQYSSETTEAGKIPTDDARTLRARLRAEIARRVPPWLRDQIDDLVQIAWFRVGQTAETDARQRTVGPSYLAKVAYCVIVDEIRRRRRRRNEVPMGDSQETAPAETVDPVRAASSREIGRTIEICLGLLLPHRRHAVALYLLGNSVAETSGLLGWPAKRAENMIFRGLADLRHCLTQKGVVP